MPLLLVAFDVLLDLIDLGLSPQALARSVLSGQSSSVRLHLDWNADAVHEGRAWRMGRNFTALYERDTASALSTTEAESVHQAGHERFMRRGLTSHQARAAQFYRCKNGVVLAHHIQSALWQRKSSSLLTTLRISPPSSPNLEVPSQKLKTRVRVVSQLESKLGFHFLSARTQGLHDARKIEQGLAACAGTDP